MDRNKIYQPCSVHRYNNEQWLDHCVHCVSQALRNLVAYVEERELAAEQAGDAQIQALPDFLKNRLGKAGVSGSLKAGTGFAQALREAGEKIQQAVDELETERASKDEG